MEALLSVGFDNISSRDGTRIRKGLRQIEGLLAQICLSHSANGPRSPHKRKSSILSDKQQQQRSPKMLRELKGDPAFREFFRLQEGFQWNVASRLLSLLERLLGMGNPSVTDHLIAFTLDLLQGVLLLHPPSRTLFERDIHMNLLLDLLDSANPPKIQSFALLVLVTALLDHPLNTRTFEAVDGLLTVTSLFKNRATAKDVRMKTLEFLYFYLMPETPPTVVAAVSAPNTAIVQRSKFEHGHFAAHARTHSGDMEMDADEEEEEDSDTRTMAEKQRLLGEYLSNVAELVQDLRESAPFGTRV